jgi:hypothetical protein
VFTNLRLDRKDRGIDVEPVGGPWGVMLTHQHTGPWNVWCLGLGVDLPIFFTRKR